MEISKTCLACVESFPITEFGISKNRKDKRSPYCKPCNRKRTNGYRATLKEMEDVRKKGIIRKPMCWKLAPDRVKQAIVQGAHTRDEIQRVTNLDWDELMDCLASFWNRQEVAIKKQGDERLYFWKAA